jgi:hypothetical protein
LVLIEPAFSGRKRVGSAEAGSPIADSTEPIADSTEPIADSTEPIADSAEPTADSVEPVIDSRNFANHEEFLRTRKEAFDEMERRRVPCEWETRQVRPGQPPTTLPSWQEYRVDLDRKHPLPEDET